MYKELNSYYKYRMYSLLYILDNAKHFDFKDKCKKEEVLKFGGTHYCVSNDVNTIDTWAVPHNENGISPNTPIFSGDVPFGLNKERYDIRSY